MGSLEIRKAAPVNTNPDKGPIVQPDNAAGRTAAYRDFGPAYADNFTIGTWWNGKHHAVGFPIACINLDNPDWASPLLSRRSRAESLCCGRWADSPIRSES
ncbi:MAG: hypothetical protein R3C56_43000 [Pirellulaceae bacterium]